MFFLGSFANACKRYLTNRDDPSNFNFKLLKSLTTLLGYHILLFRTPAPDNYD